MGVEIVAPMGGKVVSVEVKVGDQVQVDDEVLTMEAMKMEMPVVSPGEGLVKELKVSAGEAVEANQVLVVIG